MTTTAPAPMQVPMNDLSLQHATIRAEIDTALADVVESCGFILGSKVSAFEDAYARYCGVAHCVGVSNGTDALVLALRALDVGPGDEVITTPHTFGATVEAICHLGARPVLVDVEEEHLCLDPEKVPAAVTGRTKVIIPVHIYGHPADMDPIVEIAAQHGIAVVEDAAQAQGARYRGRTAGSLGRLGCFSFYPGKNLGAYGDAGGVTTDEADLAARIRALRNHGQGTPGAKFHYDEVGFNHRMDGFQGAVLGVKLTHLEAWNEQRRRLAARYTEGLTGVGDLRLPGEAQGARHVYHLYVVRSQARGRLADHLRAAGVSTAIQYPYPLHLTPAFADLGRAGDFPVSEGACSQILSLPIFPELSPERVDYVIGQVRAFFGA